jgi:Cytochrome c7 and related cytochrome c
MYKRCLFVTVIMGLLLVNSSTATTDVNKFTKTFQSDFGVVIFDHESHTKGRARDCATCHSALKTFGGKVNELFAHNFCKRCHESKNGPTECNGCHRK